MTKTPKENLSFNEWFNAKWPQKSDRSVKKIKKDVYKARLILVKLEAELEEAIVRAARKDSALQTWVHKP